MASSAVMKRLTSRRRSTTTAGASGAAGASFQFTTAQRIVFRRGAAAELAQWVIDIDRRARRGQTEKGDDDKVKCRVVVVTGSAGLERESLSEVKSSLENAVDKIEYSIFRLASGAEPTVDVAADAVAFARQKHADIIVGVGGGSAIDTAKAVAALVPQPGELLDHMEVVGRGEPLSAKPLPWLALPTTAGTGSEATKNSVFDDPNANVKASLRDDAMLATCAIIDPLLTLSVPPDVTRATGLDTLTQNIEPYLSSSSTVITDQLALKGIECCARSLLEAYENGASIDAREDMCVASLFGGISLANAKLGSVHGFAGPLGGMLHAPHGALCSAMLAASMQVNVEALKTRGTPEEQERFLPRFDTVAQVLTGDSSATAADGVAWIQSLCQKMKVIGLREFGMHEGRIAEAIEKGRRSSSMKGNPSTYASKYACTQIECVRD